MGILICRPLWLTWSPLYRNTTVTRGAYRGGRQLESELLLVQLPVGYRIRVVVSPLVILSCLCSCCSCCECPVFYFMTITALFEVVVKENGITDDYISVKRSISACYFVDPNSRFLPVKVDCCSSLFCQIRGHVLTSFHSTSGYPYTQASWYTCLSSCNCSFVRRDYAKRFTTANCASACFNKSQISAIRSRAQPRPRCSSCFVDWTFNSSCQKLCC